LGIWEGLGDQVGGKRLLFGEGGGVPSMKKGAKGKKGRKKTNRGVLEKGGNAKGLGKRASTSAGGGCRNIGRLRRRGTWRKKERF